MQKKQFAVGVGICTRYHMNLNNETGGNSNLCQAICCREEIFLFN